MCSKTVFIRTKPDRLPVRIDVLLFKDRVLCFSVSPQAGVGTGGQALTKDSRECQLKWSTIERRTKEGEECLRG